MSDFPNKEQTEIEADALSKVTEDSAFITTDDESTVFSAPKEHKVKSPKDATKKRVLSIIACFLIVGILIGGTFAIIKYIPIMINDEKLDVLFEEFAVVDEDYKTFSSVTIKNKNGEFKFVTQTIDGVDASGNPEKTTYWTVEGIDVEKLSSTTTNNIIQATANIIATRTIDTKAPKDCGFDNPTYRIVVTPTDKDPYTILIGDENPDGMGGSYMMFEGKDDIYIVRNENFSQFDFKLIDLSDVTSIPITTFPSDTADNKIEDGTYAFFDSLTLSGKLFPETITIVNNKAESDSAELLPYLITTPTNRYADAEQLNSLVALFSTENAVAGNYTFDVDEENLKLFGLDNPDAIITMTIDGVARTFKFAIVDDTYSAVIYDGATMIRKVITSNFAFLALKPENLYFKNLFMNSINDIKVLKFNDADGNIKFDISYTEDADAKKTYKILANGKEIVASNFQSFYANFVGLQCFNFSIDEIDTSPDGTITIVFNDNSETVIKFYRANATEYQYTIDGNAIGKITSSDYQKMANSIKNVAAGKAPV